MQVGLTPFVDISAAIAEIETLRNELTAVDFFPSAEWLIGYSKAWAEHSKGYSFKYRFKDSKQLAYAIASLSTRKSRLGMKIRSLALNEAPLNGLQDIHIEKNGFIGVDRASIGEPLREFVMEALAIAGEWDEIRLNSMDASCSELLQEIARENDLICYQTHSAPSYLVDYSQITQNYYGDYLQSRSLNTRAQLRQSIRRIENTYGQLSVCSASTVAQAQEWFVELAALHRQRWNKNGETNNFNDPRFTHFLSKNIDELLPSNKVTILKVLAGEKTLAIYYYFVCAEKVYFYIGGVDYSVPPALRPGTVSHFYVANFFFQQGKLIYDFMEGESRYKASLSTSASVNQGWVLQRKTKFLNVEYKLRVLKRRYIRKSIGYGRSTNKDTSI
jgi:Acetyltransferase (GNAT) domain